MTERTPGRTHTWRWDPTE